jgi:hypothetical protein
MTRYRAVRAASGANQEQKTPVWFAVRFDIRTFGIFDAFADESAARPT